MKWKLTAQKINDEISSKMLLKLIDLLIIEEASTWTETNSEIVYFLTFNHFIIDEMKRFKILLCERFSTKVQIFTTINFDEKMMNLRQKNDEILMFYYKRVAFIMFQIETRNRDIISLIQTKFILLNTVIRIFVWRISDRYVQIEAFRHLTKSNRSLRDIYAAAKKTNKNKNVIKKLVDEESKVKKLNYLKSYVLKTIIKTQLDSNLAFLSSNEHLIFSTHYFLKHSYQKNNTRILFISNYAQKQKNSAYKSSQRRNSFDEFSSYNQSIRRSFESADENSSFQSKSSNFRNKFAEDISDAKTSKNSYINDIRIWNLQANDSICVRCEEIEFRSDEAHNCVHLSIWEQFHLKQIVYDVSAQINYASAEYDEFDENVHSYDTSMRSSSQISSTSSFSEDIQIMTFSSSRDSSSANFIVCEIDELSMKNKSISSDDFSSADSKSAQIFYDEEFASNKRSHMNSQAQQSNSEEYQFQSQMNRQKRKGIKKIDDKLLQNVSRKIVVGNEWNLSFHASTKSLNCHQIRHLELSSQNILLDSETSVLAIDSKLLISSNNESVEDIIAALNDFKTQSEVIRKYFLHRIEMHDFIRAKSDARKEKEMIRYNRKTARIVHEIDSLTMIYQKDTTKLQFRWRDSFRIIEYNESHQISFTLTQLIDRKIRGNFYNNHLKIYRSRTKYSNNFLHSNEELISYQIIRQFKNKKIRFNKQLSWDL